MIAGEQVVILHDEMDPLKEFKGKKIVNANALEVALGVVIKRPRWLSEGTLE